MRSSLWIPPFIELLRAPFIEIPNKYQEESLQKYDITLGFGFRFIPGQDDFLMHSLKLPSSFDRLSFLSSSLGLLKAPRFCDSIISYSIAGSGIRGIVNNKFDKFKSVLVEVISNYDGKYGRFFVLVCLGIGCTVWYNFVPGTALNPPACDLFTPLESYDQFFDVDFASPSLRKKYFIEYSDVSATVESAFANEKPFTEISIPASGPVLTAVGLGIMLSFSLAAGLVPTASGWT